MALTAGDRLGAYEILSPIGAGGMGVVYRARDTKLKREVALKVLPDEFATDPERMARFEREARVLASLNHPNIAQIYGLEDGALAMELVAGESPKGPMTFDAAWKIAAQIAAALEYAHDKGIIHRDLKPANIKVTPGGGVKLLDFGLAKAFTAQSTSSDDREEWQTLTVDATQPGLILGTGPYLAPEQALGRAADQRVDIWAFGVVLYELLAGKRPFQGRDLAETITAIIRQQPDLEPIPPLARPLIARCLEKDPTQRLRDIGDAAFLLGAEPAAQQPKPANKLLKGALAITALLLATLAFLYFRRPPSTPQPAVRLNVLLPEKSRAHSLAVSPDGREIAMVLVKEGRQQLWVRPMDALQPVALAGTEGAADPFWSPDSRQIGFFADAKLKRIEHTGGPVQIICDALGVLGGTWNRNGDILIGALRRVQRVAATGSERTDLPGHPAISEVYPVFLPDGRHYLAMRGGPPGSMDAGIWLDSMDSAEARRILPDRSNAVFVDPPSGSQVGQILFARSGDLMALPFDVKRLEAAGDAVTLAQGIASGPALKGLFAASRQAVLAYVSGSRSGWQYVWRDRQGRNLGVAAEGAGAVVAISPDGKHLTGDRTGGTWVVDLSHGTDARLTFLAAGSNPIWSPDGRYVAYWKGGSGISRKLASGGGPEEVVLRSGALVAPKSWSPDGRFILYAQLNMDAGSGRASTADLFAIPVEGGEPLAVAQTPGNEDQGQFSPDGHWVAYTSNESGVSEIYVVPFPPSANSGKWLVSRGGGVQPRWRRDGKELFYIAPDSTLMAVDVSTGPVFQSGTPHSLFQTEIVDTTIRTGPISWDIAPDGNRFLIITDSSVDTALTVALGWRAGLKP